MKSVEQFIMLEIASAFFQPSVLRRTLFQHCTSSVQKRLLIFLKCFRTLELAQSAAQKLGPGIVSVSGREARKKLPN